MVSMHMRHSFFAQKVLSIFSFMITNYHFSCIRVLDRNNVRLESKNSFIEIRRFPSHDPLIYFLGVSFGSLMTTDKELRFNLFDLMHHAEPELSLQEVDIKTASRNFPATSHEEIESSLLRIAELFKLYTKSIGEENYYPVFEEMNKERDKIKKSYKKILLEEISFKADLAFKKRDYAEVIKLYKSIETELTPSENMKLKYARKKSGK